MYEDQEYECPICGELTDFLYVDDDEEIVGCTRCLHLRCAGDVLNDESGEYGDY